MAKTFSTMKDNVANIIRDTEENFKDLIGVWLNDAYKDISRRCNWSALIEDDYTFESSTDTALYTLPDDFEQELFVANIETGKPLKRMKEANWWEHRAEAYNADTLESGIPSRYVILEAATASIKLDPPPQEGDETYAMPYKKTITDLSGDDDTVLIKDIEFVMECWAIAQGFSYKLQYNKSTFWLNRYEIELNKRIGQEKAKINQLYQTIPAGYKLHWPRPMTGETSYDTI